MPCPLALGRASEAAAGRTVAPRPRAPPPSRKPGKDIWLFGGGELFRTLLEANLVDTVEPAVVPVLLGAGIPMLPSPASRAKLSMSGHRLYPKSGIVLLEYAVSR